MTTSELRKRIEVDRPTNWWGCECICSPRFVEATFGDGRQLVAIQPLNTRPSYYVIRVDSRWGLRGGDIWWDNLDDIYEAISDEWGEKERERYRLIEDMAEQGIFPGDPRYNDDLTGNEDRLDWPVASWDAGAGWWHIPWEDLI